MILEDKFLKKIEEIKENISKINDPLEMVRFLDEIQINTAKCCRISKKGKCNASFFYSVFFPSLYK